MQQQHSGEGYVTRRELAIGMAMAALLVWAASVVTAVYLSARLDRPSIEQTQTVTIGDAKADLIEKLAREKLNGRLQQSGSGLSAGGSR